MRREGTRDTRALRTGYTLIELLVVMGIINLMVTLVLLSVGSMLRSSRMSRSMALIVAAVDEARTAAITLRRSAKIDLTRIDTEGRMSRLTVLGPYFSDNFDIYTDAKAQPPEPSPASNGWMSTGGWWGPTDAQPPSIVTDGSRCLRMAADQTYWNLCKRIDTVRQDDFELTVMGRVKFVPISPRENERTVSVLAAIKDSGGAVNDAYRMTLSIKPEKDVAGRNRYGLVELNRISGVLTPVGTALSQVQLDIGGPPAPTTCLVENVWYRVSLSVKLITNPVTSTSKAVVAGKVWADGQLEPPYFTVGPVEDSNPLPNGTGGFGTTIGDALLDDVLFDARPIRVVPMGMRMDAMRAKLSTPDSTNVGDWEVAPDDSPVCFPFLFRPDGTSAQRYVVRVMDFTSGDKRYVTIDQSTGRARLEHSLQDAIQK